MPVYSYYCKDCTNQTATVARGINEPESSPVCPECGHQMLREYGLTGITFKGSGYYTTDKGKR